MTQSDDQLSELWHNAEAPLDPALGRKVRQQTRRWFLLLAAEITGIAIGIVIPLLTVLNNPGIFWLVWAADLWGVVGVSAWFVYQRARDLFTGSDETTGAFLALYRQRCLHQISACRVGIVLAALQFLILPGLFWWQSGMTVGESGVTGSASSAARWQDLLVPYLAVLTVMGIYIVIMTRLIRRTRAQLASLGAPTP